MTYGTTALTVACVITAGMAGTAANADATPRGVTDPGADAQSSARDGLDLDAPAQPFELNFGAFQDDSTESPSPASDWRVDYNTWIWMLGVDGDIGARDLTTNVSADFGDILDASDSLFAFSGRLEIARNRWGGFIDGTYANIGVDDVSGPVGFTAIDVTVEAVVIDFGATYRIGEWTPSGEAARNARDTTLDLYAGGRYNNLDLELDPTRLAARSRDIDWFDPIVGGKLVLPINEKWHIRANGDIGGFGVESDFTWSMTAVMGYDFLLFDRNASVFFGYRAIGSDFTEGGGSEQFTWNVVYHGPILGFSLFF
ncbi:MAG: hypothetical protein JSV91_13480 [Phycisphaerales bacterium]|nr:MAG: hypothetical protein JSV91_13480 [Phycisphaerales bacterium]